MSDEELAVFIGIANEPKAAAMIAALSAEKRAVFERMASLEVELELWQAGLGPKPRGVLFDLDRDVRRRRAWR